MANGLLGASAVLDLAFPEGIDGSELHRLSFTDGVTYADGLRVMAQGIVAANNLMFGDNLYSGLVYAANRADVKYQSGTPIATTERTATMNVPSSRRNEVGHMIPMKGYERALNWDEDFLESASLDRLLEDVGAEIMRLQDNWQKKLLTRFFDNTDNQIHATSGFDMGFANGSTTNVTYIPPEKDGQVFLSSHNHFDRQAVTAAGRAAAVVNGVDHLREHGIMGDYEMIIPLADVESWRSLNETTPAYAQFVSYERPVIRASTASDIGAPIADMRQIGYIQTALATVHVWETSRLPTGYMGLYRSFGNNNPNNALRVWFKQNRGMGAILKPRRVSHNPLDGAVMQHDFGVSAGKGRLNGFACYFFVSGSYVVPTIS